MDSACSKDPSSGEVSELDRFLSEVFDEKCVFKIPADVVLDVQESVETLVTSLVDSVSRAHPEFRAASLLKRGSSYEGTKVGLPDEFDFLVVLEKNSEQGVVRVSEGCPWNPGAAHVEISEFPDTSEKMLLPVTINRQYGTYLQEAMSKVAGFEQRVRLVTQKSGYLQLREGIQSRDQKPNTLLKLLWTSFDTCFRNCSFFVDVDVTPAIAFSGNDLRPNLSGSLYLVPKPVGNCYFGTNACQCWCVSFCAQEFAKMGKLSETHRKVYRILKVVFRRQHGEGLKTITSYMLKNGLFSHSDSCANNEGSLGACFSDTLRILTTSADAGKLKDYFIPERNVWSRNGPSGIFVITPQAILKRLKRHLTLVPNNQPLNALHYYFGMDEDQLLFETKAL